MRIPATCIIALLTTIIAALPEPQPLPTHAATTPQSTIESRSLSDAGHPSSMHSPRTVEISEDQKATFPEIAGDFFINATTIQYYGKQFQAANPTDAKPNNKLQTALHVQSQIVSQMSALTGIATTGETAASIGSRHKTGAFAEVLNQLDKMAILLLVQNSQLAVKVANLQGQRKSADQVAADQVAKYNQEIAINKGQIYIITRIIALTSDSLKATMKLWAREIKKSRGG